MNILLTGHLGYIGSGLQIRLLKNGHTVHGIDLLAGKDLLTCDFPVDIELVIHLAGKSGVRNSLLDPATYWHNNVEASRRLFERYEDTRILYASSSSAYEPDLNPYAASKFVLEELAERYHNTLGMRFHTVWSDNPRKGMFLEKLFNNKLEYVTRHYRDFIHLEDVLDAIELLITKDYINGTIDIGSGIPIRVQDLAPDLPIRLNTPNEREYTCAITERMNSLGWKPKYTIEKYLTNNTTDAIIVDINGEPI
jgi:nucleoside-diphosphate-sugar epimerase